MFQFLLDLQYQRTNDPAQGTTWIELFIAYRLAGHRSPIDRDENLAAVKPTMGAQLREFRLAIRKIAKWAFGGKDMMLFRGTEAKQQVLRNFGLRTVVATLPLQLNLTSEAAKAVATHVVRAQGQRSTQRAAEMMDNNALVKLQPLRTKGKASWASGIHKLVGGIYRAGQCNMMPSRQQRLPPVGAKQVGGSSSSGTQHVQEQPADAARWEHERYPFEGCGSLQPPKDCKKPLP